MIVSTYLDGHALLRNIDVSKKWHKLLKKHKSYLTKQNKKKTEPPTVKLPEGFLYAPRERI